MTRKRKLLFGGAIVGVALAMLVTRVFIDGAAALHDADQAFAKGDYEEAIFMWRRAARWYAPMAGHVKTAYERLETFARDVEKKGQKDLALTAWRGVRSSVKATRSFYVPFEEKLALANDNIARLSAESEDPKFAAGQSLEQRRAWHAERLALSQAPSVAWTLIAILGMAGWLGGGFLFAFRGLTSADKLDTRYALISGVLIFAGVLVWMTGLYFA